MAVAQAVWPKIVECVIFAKTRKSLEALGGLRRLISKGSVRDQLQNRQEVSLVMIIHVATCITMSHSRGTLRYRKRV